VEAVKTKSTVVLRTLQEKDFQHCFNQWSDVLNVKGSSVEKGKNVKLLKIVNKKFLE